MKAQVIEGHISLSHRQPTGDCFSRTLPRLRGYFGKWVVSNNSNGYHLAQTFENELSQGKRHPRHHTMFLLGAEGAMTVASSSCVEYDYLSQRTPRES